MKKALLIDTFALAHRAYHALPPLVSPKGITVNGVYGFLLVLLKIIKEIQPDYIAAGCDTAKPTFRHQEYKEYKAKRIKAPENFYEQIDIIKKFLLSLNIAIYEKEGYEADDILGTIVAKIKEKKDPDLQIIILTGDLDTLQLVDETTFVYTLKRGLSDGIIYTPDEVIKRYGLTPNQLVDYKALKGDPSDNIGGVPGIGEKTAISLIKQYENLDNLYQKIEANDKSTKSISPKLLEKLKANKDIAYFSRHLVMIQQDIDIDFDLDQIKWQPPRADSIVPLFKEYGFNSLILRFFPNFDRKNLTEISPKKKVTEITDAPTRQSLVRKIKAGLSHNEDIALLLNFKGTNVYQREIFSLGISFNDESFIIPVNSWPNFFEELNSYNILGVMLAEPHQVLSYATKILYQEIPQFKNGGFEDAEIKAWLIDPDRKNYTLSSLSRFYLKKEVTDNFEDHLLILPELNKTLSAKIDTLELNRVWLEIEKPLIPVLAQMEENGILVDESQLNHIDQLITQEIESLTKKIYELAQGEFNINSSQQVAKILFDKLHLDNHQIKKTHSGRMSTDITELAKIQESHSIIPLILNYRELTKLQNSFLRTLPSFINPQTNRIHTIFKQTGTATGRLSSESPNLQNIPVKGKWGQKIREAFIPQESFLFLSLDYSQIELRLIAHLSGDSVLKQLFESGQDIHQMVASQIFNVLPEQVTPSMRRQAKILNFGIVYGMGVEAISQAAGISKQEAKAFREKYFSTFIGLKMYLENTVFEAKRKGYSETLFGRKRFLPLIGSLGKLGKEQERIAINMPVQGLAADLMKLTLIKIYQFINDHKLTDQVRMLLQIHDELLLEIKSDIIEELAPQLKTIIETVYPLSVPLLAHSKIGKNWDEVE